MAKTYTWEDFQRAYETSPFRDQFSQADLNLARQNPDAGMSLLSYKTDYHNATTDEARALANQGAESIRSSYGGYTGGGDGGSFKLNPMSPNQFTYGDAPTFEDKWEGRIADALDAQMAREPYSYGGGPAPEYQNRYDPMIQNTLTGILDRGEFSYDPKTDPVYAAYQKQYAREGARATANAMGEAAAMTGGMPSSWAMTAASQAGDYYGAQMADKIPELYQDAYNRYLQEYQMKLSDLNALRGLESDDYTKFRDQLSQYNKDRDFDYATWLDNIKLGQQDIDTLRALRSDDLALYQTNLGQYNTDRSFDYGQWLDEISNQRTREQDAWNQAETAAKYGDYSRLNAKGVDTSSAEYADLVSRGVQAAQYGDYSLLNQAGIDTSTAQFKEQLAIAQEKAAVGDYSGYAAMGIDTSNAQLMDQLNIQAKQASIASTYANMPTAEERALDLAYRQAQIQNMYAGMPTEEERALELAYKQAQIDKMYAGGSSSDTGLTENQRMNYLLKAADMLYDAGDFDGFSAVMAEAGYDVNTGAVQDKKTADQAAKNAKGNNLKGLSDSEVRQELALNVQWAMSERAKGNEELQTRAQIEKFVRGMTGYKMAYDPVLKELVDEAFKPVSSGKNSTTHVLPGPRQTIQMD